MLKTIRKWLKPLRRTPLHPQWLAMPDKRLVGMLSLISSGDRVLDVGCADSWPRRYVSETADYVGFDYPATAIDWYGTKPEVFGDAEKLPFRNGRFDVVLLFDVLEHLPDPQAAIGEIRRVLKPGGLLLMNTPFLYPLHDEPRDYQRWTRHGFEQLARRSDFRVESIDAAGSPVRNAFLVLNISLSKMCINGLTQRRPAALLLPLLPVAVLLNNCLAWSIGLIEPEDDFMPLSYKVIWRRPMEDQPG